MGDVPSRVGVMRELESTDLRLGIDDFGSGYTLLSYLKRFPIDYLRIDRLFTVSSRGRGEQSSPDGDHRLAQALGIKVLIGGSRAPDNSRASGNWGAT
jgi:EAL domain-containing protein (putative c-di-GMP-specific phosphodiesterase class I)